MATVRETIRILSQKHLDDGYMIAGQCLSAVGFVGGTLPESHKDKLTELSMADVGGAGFVVGMALADRRPMYVIRYQGFSWYNAPMIVNYAAKSKSLWNTPCPMIVRCIAMEGNIGPVAGCSHHSLYDKPGIKTFSPMTPREWESVYFEAMSGDDVVCISEHRKSYDNKNELPDITFESPDFVLYPISVTRFAAIEASRQLSKLGMRCSVSHIVDLDSNNVNIIPAYRATRGLVLDDDYSNGVASKFAAKIMHDVGQYKKCTIDTMGVPNVVGGFGSYDVVSPDVEKIVEYVRRYQ